LNGYDDFHIPATTISFNINIDYHGIVIVKIYHAKGQFIKLLAMQANGSGLYEIFWDGSDKNGDIAASGLYFYSVDFRDAVLASKMILLK